MSELSARSESSTVTRTGDEERTRHEQSADWATLTHLLAPDPKRQKLALAEGGTVLPIPQTDDVADDWVETVVEKATSVEALDDLEMALMQKRESARAIGTAARKSTSPTGFQEELFVRAKKAERLHIGHMSATLRATRPVEVQAWQHFSFFAEARIPPDQARLRGTIRLFPSKGLATHPKMGTAEFCGPLSGIGNVHRDVFGLCVFSEEVMLNDEVVGIGGIAGDHTAVVYVSIPVKQLNSLDKLRRNKEGEENVVLTCIRLRVRRASVYEDSDVEISGAFAAAGMEFFKMNVAKEHGLASATTGCQAPWVFSDAYALYEEERGPLVIDFGDGQYDQMPECVLVGASATNSETEETSLFNTYGNHTARSPSPSFQIPIRFSLNHLQRILKIHGHRFLVDQKKRAKAIDTVQSELRQRLVGPAPQPFEKLELVEDIDSESGKAAQKKGGVLVQAKVTINSRTEFVELVILPLLPPVPDDGSD